MRLEIYRKPYFKWLALIGLMAGAWYSWGQITAVKGAQRVDFVRAKETCGATGGIKYCVYRAATGTNGDVVYHMHGRNLDERI